MTPQIVGEPQRGDEAEDASDVSERSLGSLLIEGLEQALAFERGEGAGRVVEITAPPLIHAHDVRVSPPPPYGARQVRELRRELLLSQQVFSQILRVSVGTVRAWEQGEREPSGTAARLLEIVARHPDAVRAVMHARQDHEREGTDYVHGD